MTRNSRQRALGRAVAVSLVFSLAESWGYVRAALGPLLDVQIDPLFLGGIWSWILLLLTTAAGLAAGRRWGAYLLVGLVPISTVLLSVPLIPMVTSLAPPSYRPHVLLVVNTLVLLTVPLLLRRPSPTDSARAPGVLAAG